MTEKYPQGQEFYCGMCGQPVFANELHTDKDCRYYKEYHKKRRLERVFI